jgi:phospholipid/cholesterol/gamma-HCH transport system permease protein
MLFSQTVTRRVDFLFALEECGPQAIGIVSLISFMVGLILAFVGAIQLKTFGAQIYVASLVTIAMIRIMGAIMCGIIMAGRTGASFAATLGTMQVNEETDALKTMGIPLSDFLVLPRMAALVLVMPLLTMWSDFMGIFGGAAVGIFVLDIPASEYLKYSVQAWSATNFWVGMFHGFIFGFIIALCGCYEGLNCDRNAGGVGQATTRAVVSAIVWMIVATGLITLIFERLGI